MSQSDMKDGVFMKNFALMTGALAVTTVALFFLAQAIGGKAETAEMAKKDGDTTAVAQRIQPVGSVSIASKVMDAVVPVAQAADGKGTYGAACAACHGTGAAGAPKLGDKAEWKGRIAKGNPALYKSAISGFQGKKGFMPAKGGNTSLSDADVKAAVDHMVAAVK